MPNTYRFALKSEELYGAGQPNILEVGLASDADALIFKDNLELSFDGIVISVDTKLASDYTLPYPTGSNRELRGVMRDAVAGTETFRLYNVDPAYNDQTLAVALIAAGLLLPRSFTAAVSINFAEFYPGKSF
jgi:hypothetical protein